MLKTGSKKHRILQVILIIILGIAAGKHIYDAKQMQKTYVEFGGGSFGGGGAGGSY